MSNINDDYNKIVANLEKNVFHTKNDTDNFELDKFGREQFGSEFGGVFAEDTKVNFDSNKKYYIFNTDKANESGTHWIGVYVDHPNESVYVFDTFHRETSKLLPDLYMDIKHYHMRVSTKTPSKGLRAQLWTEEYGLFDACQKTPH